MFHEASFYKNTKEASLSDYKSNALYEVFQNRDVIKNLKDIDRKSDDKLTFALTIDMCSPSSWSNMTWEKETLFDWIVGIANTKSIPVAIAVTNRWLKYSFTTESFVSLKQAVLDK